MKVGLGPLICVECELFAREDIHHDYYLCPKCGSDVLEYLWMFDENQQRRIHANDRFYRFVRGQDAAPNDG